MQSFKDVKSKSISETYKEIDFPITRNQLITDNPEHDTQYLFVERTDKNIELGIVKEDRPFIPYKQVMKWLLEEFEKSGLSYKLRDSVIMDKGDLYQEYIFDEDIDTPDNSDMAPLSIVKASYTGCPLEIFFGTYRFVCSNGVMTGETVEKIHVSPKVKNLLQSSITDDIKQSINKFSEVSNLYKKLYNESFNMYLQKLMMDYYLTAGYKKAILNMIQSEGNIEIVKQKLKKKDFLTENTNIYRIVNDIDAWTLYNIVTQVITTKSRSAGARFRNYQIVSRLFEI